MILLSLLILFSSSARAAEPVVAEFEAAFARAVSAIEGEMPELKQDIPLASLEDMLRASEIAGTDEILFVTAGEGEQESVAVNEPAARRIFINRARWAGIASEHVKEAVALHELLSLQRLEATGAYPFSARYLAKFGGRADAAYLIAGQDPKFPDWRSRRISCEKVFNYLDKQRDRVFKNSSFTLSAVSRWKIRDAVYSIQWSFGDDEPSVATKIPLSQTVERKIGRDGDGITYEISERIFLRSVNDTFSFTKPTVQFVEVTAGNRNTRFLLEKNERGPLVGEDTLTELGDGSLRLVSNNLISHPEKTVRTLRSDTTCVITRLPQENWVGITGQADVLASFENLTRLAKAANEAALKPHAEALRILTEEKAFLAAWDALYQDQIKKQDVVPYLPKKGIKGSLLAAGRAIKPYPKALLALSLRQVDEDMRRGTLKPPLKVSPPAHAKNALKAPVKTKYAAVPTFIPSPGGGPPILRMPGQSLNPGGAELRGIQAGEKALNEYKKMQGL